MGQQRLDLAEYMIGGNQPAFLCTVEHQLGRRMTGSQQNLPSAPSEFKDVAGIQGNKGLGKPRAEAVAIGSNVIGDRQRRHRIDAMRLQERLMRRSVSPGRDRGDRAGTVHIFHLRYVERRGQRAAKPAGGADMVDVGVSHDDLRHAASAQGLRQQSLPGGNRSRIAIAGVDDGPAALVGEQIDIGVADLHGSGRAGPAQSGRDLHNFADRRRRHAEPGGDLVAASRLLALSNVKDGIRHRRGWSCPVNVTGFVAGEEGHHVGHVLGRAKTLKRYSLALALPDLRRVQVLEEGLAEAGVDDAGRDAIGADAIAAFLFGDRAAQHFDTRLRNRREGIPGRITRGRNARQAHEHAVPLLAKTGSMAPTRRTKPSSSVSITSIHCDLLICETKGWAMTWTGGEDDCRDRADSPKHRSDGRIDRGGRRHIHR